LHQIALHTDRPSQGFRYTTSAHLRATTAEQVRADGTPERTEAELRSDARNAYLHGLPARKELHARGLAPLTRRRARATA
jgi:hypothetical protein